MSALMKQYNPQLDTTQERVYIIIKEMIVSGQITHGERIVERRIAEQVGSSRVPVREALLRLSSDGLLESVPRLGFMVKKYTLKDAVELYELREYIEGGAAFLAAKNATKEDIARLQKAHMAFREKIEQVKVISESNSSANFDLEKARSSSAGQDEIFHRSIIKASRNSRFRSFFNNLSDQHLCLLPYKDGRLFTELVCYDIASFEHHKLILEAVVKGDGKAAEEAAREHVRAAKASLIKRLDNLDDIYLA